MGQRAPGAGALMANMATCILSLTWRQYVALLRSPLAAPYKLDFRLTNQHAILARSRIYRLFGLVLHDVEAGLLPGGAFFQKIPGVLCDAAEFRRGELYLPESAQRDNDNVMACGDRAWLPVFLQGPATHHPHFAAQELRCVAGSRSRNRSNR